MTPPRSLVYFTLDRNPDYLTMLDPLLGSIRASEKHVRAAVRHVFPRRSATG